MSGAARLRLPPDIALIAEARRFVADALNGANADPLFLVAVNEVVTNAIEEHHRIGSAAPVTIEVDVETRTVKVADQGRGYESTSTPARPSPLAERGRGLFIARAVNPELTWERNEPNGTVFVLTYSLLSG